MKKFCPTRLIIYKSFRFHQQCIYQQSSYALLHSLSNSIGSLHVLFKKTKYCDIKLHANDTFIYRGITYSIIDVNARKARVGTGEDSGENLNAVTSDYGPDLHIPNFVTYSDTIFSVTEVGTKAFRNCWNLRTIKIGFAIEIIRDQGFSQCRNVTSLTFDQNSRLQILEGSVFYDFYALTSVTFTGNNLTKIGNAAFAFAYSLETITIPPSVTYIGTSAFKGLNALKSIQYCGNTPITEDVFDRIEVYSHITPSNIEIKVTSSYPASYFATDTFTIDDNIVCIFPKAITYNLLCSSYIYECMIPNLSYFFVFIII